MKLRKDDWKEYAFPEAIDFQEGPGFLTKDFRNEGIPLIRLAGMDDNVSLLNGCNYLEPDLVAKRYSHFRIKAGDIILSTSATLGKTSIVDQEADGAIVYTGLVRMRAKNNQVHTPFIKYLLQGASFVQQIDSMGVGSVMKHFGPTHLKRISIKIPTIDEQQRIVELFQSVEQGIILAEEQEKNLRRLHKVLIDGFVSDKPNFGSLLKSNKLQKVYYRDVVQKLMRKINPAEYGVERIVAGENLESEDLKIRTWGTVGKDFLGPAFHVLFQSGDILYGSRRTYLRKVSLADFEGVCANTTYVIRANEEILLQDLLKHIMLSERFTQYSIGVSKGSTNPYINWKDLDNFIFEIPDLDTQRIIANLLDEILATAEKIREQTETLKKLKQKLLNEILG